jgi:hypothetical protein
MRIIHLIDTLLNQLAGPTLGLLRDLIHATASDDVQHHILAVGPPSLTEQLDAFQLPHELLPCRSGAKLAATWALKRWTSKNPSVDSAPHIVHAWSLAGAALAAKALPDTPLITTLSHLPPDVEAPVAHLATTSTHNKSRIWATTDALRDWAVNQGADPARVTVQAPIIDPLQLATDDRPTIRRRMGMPDGIAVALLADSPATADAMQGFGAVLLVEGTGLPIKLVAHPQSLGLNRALHIMNSLDRGRGLISTSLIDQPWEALPGCDLALHLSGTISLAWAMAAGLPIVSTGACGAGAWLTNHEAGIVAAGQKAGDIARQLMVLAEDSEKAGRLGANARQYALVHLAPHHTGAKILDLYQQASRAQLA